MQVLTEAIEEQCLSSDGNLVDLLIQETKEYSGAFAKLLEKVPASGRRDIDEGLWMTRDNCLIYRLDIREKNQLKLNKDKQIIATVIVEWYFKGSDTRVACVADKKHLHESSIFLYNFARNESFIKSYSQSSYKSGKSLMDEFRQELLEREWVQDT